jgi:NADPH2:quinone reductase
MRAAVAEAGKVEVREVPVPEPGPGQLLLRVHAAGLNAADRLLIAGHYRVGASVRPPSASPAGPVPVGTEAAGEVVAVGADVTGFASGDRVMAMGRGAFAEYAAFDAGRALHIPAGLGWVEAAAVPVVYATAHDALATAGRLVPGESVLVNAASSGVGVAVLQLARLLGAGLVIGTSTSPAKFDRLRAAGVPLDVALDGSAADLGEQLLAATGGEGVDVVVDSVGGTSWPSTLAAAALGGRVVSVGRLGGTRADVDLDELARKRVSLVGVSFRTRSGAAAAEVFAAAGPVVLPGLADGRLRVLVDRTFPLAEVASAEDHLGAGGHIGKVVLTVT